MFVQSDVALSKHMGCDHGAYVAFVHPKSQLAMADMVRGDVLCSIDDHPVDLRGRAKVPWWIDGLEVETVLERKNEGEACTVSFWSQSKKTLVTTTVTIEKDLNVFRPLDPEMEFPRFSCEGGLVVQSLSENHVRHEAYAKSYTMLLLHPKVRMHSLLVVTYVRPESCFTKMGVVKQGKCISAINDIEIRTMDDYETAWKTWKAGQDPYIKLAFFDGEIAIADRSAVEATNSIVNEELDLGEHMFMELPRRSVPSRAVAKDD